MKMSAIERLLERMQEEEKEWNRLRELYEKYRKLKAEITSDTLRRLSLTESMDFFAEYDKAFMAFTGYLHVLVDVKYITRDYYYKILEEV